MTCGLAVRVNVGAGAGAGSTTIGTLAVRVPPGGGVGFGATMSSTLCCAVPPTPVAVTTYLTDFSGATIRVPVEGTSPIPGSIRTLSAWRTFHLSTVGCLGVIMTWLAVISMTGLGTLTVMRTLLDSVPPGPVAVIR